MDIVRVKRQRQNIKTMHKLGVNVCEHGKPHLINDTLSDQNEHYVTSMGVHRDETHDTLTIILL